MARVLGYGGLANTNGARDFSGKTVAVVAGGGWITSIAARFIKPTDRN